jgi:DNA-binding transcriptional ArsR family regulator
MPRPQASSDVFSAVSDPTRRAILDRLRRGSAPVNDIASGFRMTRPAVSRHLRVLRRAHLVREKRSGRERIYELTPDRIEHVARWAEEYRQFWHDSLTNLKRHLESEVEEKSR